MSSVSLRGATVGESGTTPVVGFNRRVVHQTVHIHFSLAARFRSFTGAPCCRIRGSDIQVSGDTEQDIRMSSPPVLQFTHNTGQNLSRSEAGLVAGEPPTTSTLTLNYAQCVCLRRSGTQDQKEAGITRGERSALRSCSYTTCQTTSRLGVRRGPD